MQCVVCNSEAPAGVWQCPRCGEHLGRWLDQANLAGEQLRQGAFWARRGDLTRALLALTKAAALNPEDAATLKALAKALARAGLFEEARFYLAEASNVSDPGDPEIEAIARKIEELQQPADTSAAAAPPESATHSESE